MADYPPPQENNPIWNAGNFLYGTSNLTIDTANGLYLKKTGADTAVGPLTIRNQLYMSDGTAALPSITFTNNKNSGISNNAGTLNFSVGGGTKLQIITDQISSTVRYRTTQTGSVSSVSYGLTQQIDTGLYFPTQQSVGISTAGVQRLAANSSAITSTVPYQTSSLGFPAASYGNTTNTNTGLYFGTSTTCGIVCNGNANFTFGSTSNTSFNPITAPDASVSLPSYNFSSSSNTGLYYTSGPVMNVAVNGVQRFSFEGSGMKFYNSVSGYTPSLLNYYEEYTATGTNWKWGNLNYTANYRITRIGRVCIWHLSDAISYSSNPSSAQQICTLDTNNLIPARFRGQFCHQFGCVYVNDIGTGTFQFWQAQIDTNGNIVIVRPSGSTSSYPQIYTFSGSWTI